MSNTRLRTQLQQRGLTVEGLAEAVEVDPKTVERWISTGRVPHRRHRVAASQQLGVEEAYLWPEILDDADSRAASQAELVATYPHRGAVPDSVWRHLVERTKEQLEVLVYSGLFLLDSHPDLPARLKDAAANGLQARLLYGDPTSEVVAWRGDEEGIGANLAARISLALTYLEPLRETNGVEVRLHRTVLYNSIYRFDDQMLVNTHVVGSPAPQNPVLHLRRLPGGHLFDHYLRSFDRVWEQATGMDESTSGEGR